MRTRGSLVSVLSAPLVQRAGPTSRLEVAKDAMDQAMKAVKKGIWRLEENATHAERVHREEDGREYEVLFRVVALNTLNKVKSRFTHQEAATGAIILPLERGLVALALVIQMGYSKAKRKHGTRHAREVAQHRGFSPDSGNLSAGGHRGGTLLGKTSAMLAKLGRGPLDVLRFSVGKMAKWRTSWSAMTDADACRSASTARGTAGGRGKAQKGGAWFSQTGYGNSMALAR